MTKKWTDEEIEYLREQYQHKDPSDIADVLGRTKKSVIMKANKLKIHGCRWWTDDEKNFALSNYAKMSYMDIGKAIGKSEKSVSAFMKRNGCKKREWTDDQVAYFQENFGKTNLSTMCKNIGKSKSALFSKAYNDGLGSYKNNMEHFTAIEVAEILGVEKSVIARRCKKGTIKARKKNNYWHINEDDLIEFMKNNPEKWKASNCDYYFFSRFDWFQKKLKEEQEEKIKKRWGALRFGEDSKEIKKDC